MPDLPIVVAIVVVSATALLLFCRGRFGKKQCIDRLIAAAIQGKKDEVESLLRAKPGAVSAVDAGGNHALSAAIAGGHLELCEVLLDQGAPMHLANAMGCSPVWLAAGYGHANILALLLSRIQADRADGGEEAASKAANLTNAAGDSALLAAVSQGKGSTVEMLLERRADLTLSNKRGALPLHIATQNGDTELVALLAAAGADAAVVDGRQLTALHVAASVQGGVNPKLVESLVSARADPFAKDLNGATPFAVAAHCGSAKMVEALARPDILEVPDHNGRPPLWVAASLGKLDAVRALVAARANIGVVSGHEAAIDTALKVATKNQKHEVANFLEACEQ